MLQERESCDDLRQWIESNNFCALPFVHTAVTSNGDVLPCCVGSPLQDANGNNLNMRKSSIGDILSHDAYVAFRDSFRRNEQHPSCGKCWSSPVKFSTRVRFSMQPALRHVVAAAKRGDDIAADITWLEVHAGNRCNLKCRICDPHHSDQWAYESYELRYHGMDSKVRPPFKWSRESHQNFQSQWIAAEDVWRDMGRLSTIETVHLTGGEPMMVPEHRHMLRQMIESGRAKEVSIIYSTNASILPDEELLSILDEFKSIGWHLSIDDIGRRFEYQRKNASWKDVESNLDYFWQLQTGRCSFLIEPAISIFNVRYLDELLEFLSDRWDVNPGHFVSGIYDIRLLSAAAKDIIAEHYNHSGYARHPLVIETLNYMKQTVDDQRLISERQRMLCLSDMYRNESFSDTHPEMAKLIFDE